MLLETLKEDMVVEENLSKFVYKIVLYLTKMIPILIAVASLLNTVLSYFCIDLPILSYFGGLSVLTILYLYATSIAFKFCIWHRLLIHYIVLNWLISIVDYHVGIPISDRSMFLVYMMLAAVILFLILYFKFVK